MAGFLSPSALEQIRAASDIVEVIGAVLPLKRAGANFVTLCPFHREKSPSFNVNPHRQIFHCFGCHKGGDVFTFIREYENLSFMEAVRRLAERARIPIQLEDGPGGAAATYLKEKLLQIHEQIAQRWQAMLNNDAAGQIARDYLAKRGVSPEAVQLFRLGYAPEQWDDTVNWGASKSYDPPLLEQAGLVIRKEDSNRYYDRFRGRLMFPICDEQGRVIAFSGRVLVASDQGAKYVNSPETTIFKKGKIFYGLDKSKRAILDEGFAIVCEGQLDLIACYMGGVKNVVAPQGTAFTPEHARMIKRYVDEVVLCFDSDTAGQKAAVRIEESLLASKLGIRVATIPAPHDPDSYIKEFGGPGFQALISSAREFFDFYLDYLCATHEPNTEKGQLAVVREMAAMINKSGDRVLADKYAQKTAFKLSSFMQLPVSPEAIRAEFRKVKPNRPNQTPEDSPEEAPADEEVKPSEREFWLLRFVLAGDDQIDWLTRAFDPTWIEHPVIRQVVLKRCELHLSQSWHGVPALIETLESPVAQRWITRAVAEQVTPESLARNLIETVLRVRNDFIERELKLLTLRRAQPNVSEDEAIQIESRKIELRRLKAQPITEESAVA